MLELNSAASTQASLVAVLYVAYRLWQARQRARRAAEKKMPIERDIMVPYMDIKRQNSLAKGQAIDNSGCCLEQEDPDFDLDKTIFSTLEGFVPRTILRKQLARKPHWSDDAIQAIQQAYRALPEPPPVDKAITDFMMTECNFKMEHADGSFMDHIVFCHDYCAQHYKGQSPRILLLHSIMGVGTNLFPMHKSKMPQLQALLTEEEFKHIEAFPSIVRMLVSGALLGELHDNRARLDRLERVTMHRVIDNKEIEIDAESLWVHLNFHVIHLVDFLPVADWPQHTADHMLQIFLEVRDFLIKAGQLRCKLELGSACGTAPSQEALFDQARGSYWGRFKRGMAAKNIRKYSDAIQHSLKYTLHFR